MSSACVGKMGRAEESNFIGYLNYLLHEACQGCKHFLRTADMGVFVFDSLGCKARKTGRREDAGAVGVYFCNEFQGG